MINWASLKDTTASKDEMRNHFSNFVSDANTNIQYLSDQKQTLSEEEYQTLEQLNKKSNKIRKQAYHTTLFSLSIRQLLEQWSNNMIHFTKDIIEMIYTRNISFENMYLLIHTDDRLFFIGMTLLLVSFMLFVSGL